MLSVDSEVTHVDDLLARSGAFVDYEGDDDGKTTVFVRRDPIASSSVASADPPFALFARGSSSLMRGALALSTLVAVGALVFAFSSSGGAAGAGDRCVATNAPRAMDPSPAKVAPLAAPPPVAVPLPIAPPVVDFDTLPIAPPPIAKAHAPSPKVGANVAATPKRLVPLDLPSSPAATVPSTARSRTDFEAARAAAALARAHLEAQLR